MDHNLIIIPSSVEKGDKVTIRLIDKSGEGQEAPKPFLIRLGAEIYHLTPTWEKQTDAVFYTWELETNEVETRGYTVDVGLEPETGTDVTFEVFASGELTVYSALGSISRATNRLADRTELGISLKTTDRDRSTDMTLWVEILRSSERLSFNNYLGFMDLLFCDQEANVRYQNRLQHGSSHRFLPFSDTDSYRVLKVATEAFVMTNCEIAITPTGDNLDFPEEDINQLIANRGFNIADAPPEYNDIWNNYIQRIQIGDPMTETIDIHTIPYLYLIRDKLSDLPLKQNIIDNILDNIEYVENGTTATSGLDPIAFDRSLIQSTCKGLIASKLSHPCFIELIWSYWHEECMLIQVLNAITRRFQNIRSKRKDDPLAGLHIDPLQPLNNLIWGYIQDEQHRLSVKRRAYEYDHHYGFSIKGKAISDFRPADSRSQFIQAFHKLLNLCSDFFKQEDNTTIDADAFPIRNALREVHLILAEGAHNQYGDLPSTSRIEMMMQQYLLARPEFRQFIPTRNMVAYPEPWMDRVAAVNKMMSWTETSIIHFNNLAIFGEQLLLSIRFGSWSITNTSANQAAVWANFWRQAVQEYIHAYHGVTGIDLAAERKVTTAIDTRPPSFHLAKRLQEQQNGTAPKSKATATAKSNGQTTVKKETW